MNNLNPYKKKQEIVFHYDNLLSYYLLGIFSNKIFNILFPPFRFFYLSIFLLIFYHYAA